MPTVVEPVLEIEGTPASRLREHAPLIVLAAIFAIAAVVAHPYDEAWSHLLRFWKGLPRPIADEGVSAIRSLGKGEVAVVLALAFGALGRRREAWRILCALLIVGVVVTLMKHGFARIRPSGGATYSFPSGDSATVAAVFSTLMVRSWRFAPLYALPILAVAFGRVHEGYHYPADVCAGISLGILASIAASWAPRPRWGWMNTRGWLMLLIAFLGVVWATQEWTERNHPFARPDVRMFVLVFGPVLAWRIALKHLRIGWWRNSSRWNLPAWAAPALLTVAILVLSLWFSGRSTLWDRDEPRFARATVEMVASGDYLVPSFNGEPRLHKPVLSYWLMSVPVRLFGSQEWSVRLPAVLGSIATCWLLWWTARTFLGSRAGHWPIAIFATCPLVMVCGTAATTDAVLVAFITAAMALFAARLVTSQPEEAVRPHWGTTLLMGTAIGCALLVKGPLGLVVPALAFAMTALLLRGSRTFSGAFWWHVGGACLIALALFFAWAIPANDATHGQFLREGFGKHVVGRMGTSFESHGGGFWYYAPVVLATFFPWIMLLPAAVSSQLAKRQGPLLRAYLFAWLIPSFVVMSAVATKLPHYILPIFPALALATAALVMLPRCELSARDRRWLAVGRWLAGIVGVALVIALIAAPWAHLLKALELPPRLAKNVARVPQIPGLLAPALSLALIIGVMIHAAWRYQGTLRLRGASAILASGMTVWAIVVGWQALPVVERLKLSKPLAQQIREHSAADVPIVVSGYDEASFHFYMDRGPIPRLGSTFEEWAAAPGRSILVTTDEHLRSQPALAQAHVAVIARVEGVNIANGALLRL
ncbi:MAG: glycosyltransferase family 39 protein, partial [Planctomycetes bacterium]|nr:glycosyltransferase family 39 protein [Planctomycetota bacterium]